VSPRAVSDDALRRIVGRGELRAAALQQAGEIVAHARSNGGYTLQPIPVRGFANPGLFQGVAGIGYALLRLTDPSLPNVLLVE